MFSDLILYQPLKYFYICNLNGELAEWSIVAVSKTVVRATGPGVRIPRSPQNQSLAISCRAFFILRRSNLFEKVSRIKKI